MGSVSRPPCIEPRARKEEYFGLETEPMSTRPSQLKFQLSAPQAVLPIRERNFRLLGDCAVVRLSPRNLGSSY